MGLCYSDFEHILLAEASNSLATLIKNTGESELPVSAQARFFTGSLCFSLPRGFEEGVNMIKIKGEKRGIHVESRSFLASSEKSI